MIRAPENRPLPCDGGEIGGRPPRFDAPRAPAMLLVSVRDGAEAAAALAAGCRWIDAKDPARGSLGFAGDRALREVVAAVRGFEGAGNVVLSAALGEVADWRDRAPAAIPAEVTFAKLGLAGLRSSPRWIDEWRRVRSALDRAALRDADACEIDACDAAPRGRPAPLSWIAVAYADALLADTPEPERILAAAVETGCAGLLVDTWDKSAGTLFDHLSEPRLRSLIDAAARAGLVTALAGRLRIDQIGRAAALGPSVVAVRSAACRDADRGGAVDRDAVRRLVELISWSPAPSA